ncbi:MAG: NADH-quinone oxidoreductase subunit A [Bacteroidota bacterium]
MFESYLPILILLTLAVVIGVVMSNVNAWFGPKRPSEEKSSTYESGMKPVRNARERVSVKYYMVALLFIIFDIEVVFLYPWAVNFRALGVAGYIEMFSFMLFLFVGYIYMLKKGVFRWD